MIANKQVLLFSYDLWRFVLNVWYLPQAAEDSDYEREEEDKEELRRNGIDPYRDRPLPKPWRSQMIASWERIFDVGDLRETETIQASFERLRWQDVVRVTFFTVRPRRLRIHAIGSIHPDKRRPLCWEWPPVLCWGE